MKSELAFLIGMHPFQRKWSPWFPVQTLHRINPFPKEASHHIVLFPTPPPSDSPTAVAKAMTDLTIHVATVL